jgi:hypothetical protein
MIPAAAPLVDENPLFFQKPDQFLQALAKQLSLPLLRRLH